MTTQHSLLNFAALIAASISLSSSAQETTQGDVSSDDSWYGEISVNTAVARCGANESYYPVQFLTSGDVVRVVGKRQEWYQVVADGKAFDGVVGFIKYPEKNSSVFFVEGKTGTSSGDIEIIANNLESEELYRSWRPVCRLQEGDTALVLHTEKKAPGTLHREAYIVHTVDMPPHATVWISASSITPVTESVSKTIHDQEGGEYFETVQNSSTTAGVTIENGDEPVVITLNLSELEDAWSSVSKEPVMSAEIEPLYDLYGQLLEENSGDIVVERIAAGRMKQLEIWKHLKTQKDRIGNMRNSLSNNADAVEEFIEVMDTYGDYAVVGRIALSNTFNGKIRPLMYRLQNSSGRTIGYLPHNTEWDISSIIGQVVGVKGSLSWDHSWRVNIVEATDFDLLSPASAEASGDIQ